jgi:hypothetical protein
MESKRQICKGRRAQWKKVVGHVPKNIRSEGRSSVRTPDTPRVLKQRGMPFVFGRGGRLSADE